MKKLIALTIFLTAGICFADSTTSCWTDSQGVVHCTTVERPSGDITPRW